VKHRNRNMPQDSKILEWHGFLGFPTRIRYQLTNMEEVEWVSRQQRKRRRLPFAGRTSEWWESERISQWMCVLFMIGSLAFAAGALLCFDLSLPVIIPAVIFFVGSLFFTSAAYLQFLEAINVPDTSAKAQAGGTNRARYFAWEPDRIDWWSTITQFLGTLYFNFSTFNAMRMNLSLTKIDRLVWSADFLGSILFLISSWLAYGEVASALTSPKLKSLTWWVVLSNLLGSIAFGVSAITSFVLPSQGEMINANVTNLFTALGGVCFFVGALLQLLETNRENAAANKDNADKIRVSTPDTSNLVEGQT
jgi:hypothetical protein